MIQVEHIVKEFVSPKKYPGLKGAIKGLFSTEKVRKLAVDDISFSIDEGEIVGYIGSNGAGKSTTMNMLTGYISSTSGQILINGVDILEEPKKAKSFIGYLPEIPPLYVDMTVKSYLNFIYDLKSLFCLCTVLLCQFRNITNTIQHNAWTISIGIKCITSRYARKNKYS